MKWKKSVVISAGKLVDISFILFFSSDLVRMVINKLLGTGSLSRAVVVLIIYTPLLSACIANPRRYIKADVILLYLAVVFFFLLTWLIHPEYGCYYARSDYGVWNYVLLPYRGIYAYLFVRLMDKPQRFIRNFQIAGWLMLVSFACQLILYLKRGYWSGVIGVNGQARMAYSVSFGYGVLPFALFFAYQALKKRRVLDWIAAGLAFGMILAGGSRGPVLFFGGFAVLYCLTEWKNSRRKFKILLGFTAVVFLLYGFRRPLTAGLSGLFSHMGFSSRFLTSLLRGGLSNDSGRRKIWAVAVRMIQDNPLGYGAMGSQHVLSNYIYAGYPHSLVLELLIDFGVIFGTILLMLLFYHALLMLFSSRRRDWIPAFLPLFCASCCLFISLSYWGLPAFWACIGMGVNCIMGRKAKRLVR